MPDHTPADKPDLPALPICDGFGKHGDEIYLPDSVREYGRRCAETARADERRKARADLIAEQWVPVEKGEPHCEGQYVIRINKHGHIRLGQRVLNSDTLRHQWQVDGEVCKTVTHYHPVPPLTLSKE